MRTRTFDAHDAVQTSKPPSHSIRSPYPLITHLTPITISIRIAERPKRGESSFDFIGESIRSGRRSADFTRSRSAVAAGARQPREEGIRIEKVQAGARKRRRVRGSAANMEGKNDVEEDGQVQDIITVATNRSTGRRKGPCAVQAAS